jgi:hypothetical protein
VAVPSEAAAGIDSEYVVAAGQPGANCVHPIVVARLILFRKIGPLLPKSPHASSTLTPPRFK